MISKNNNYIKEAMQLAETYSDKINDCLCFEEDKTVAYTGEHSFFNTANTIDVHAPVARSVSKNGKPDFRIPGGNFVSLPCNGLAVSAWKDMLVSLVFTTENEPEKIQVSPEVYSEIRNHIPSKTDALAGYHEGLGEAVCEVERDKEYQIEEIRGIAADCQDKGQAYLDGGLGVETTYAFTLGKANALFDAGDILNRAADKLAEKLKQRNLEKDGR